MLDFIKYIADFEAIDVHFGQLMAQKADSVQPSPNVAVAAALAQFAVSQGNTCVDLNDYAATPLHHKDGRIVYECPPYTAWLNELKASGIVGPPGMVRPLVLDAKGYLYLYKYYNYQQQIQEFIQKYKSSAYTNHQLPAVNSQLLKGLHANQAQAVEAAIKHPFSVVSGGPGTGKTTTVKRILEGLLELKLVKPNRIFLAAPTGKAAARLGEAVGMEASTIHRLLMQMPKITAPKLLTSQLKLSADLVVVDEASMADIELLTKLMGKLASGTRFILVGDHAQLTSVGAGSVLSDICAALAGQSNLTVLTHNYRFKDADAHLNKLTQAVRAGDAAEALSAANIEPIADYHQISAKLTPLVLNNYLPCFTAASPEKALALFDGFRILCALREGYFGAQHFNNLCQSILQKAGAKGKPVVITKNDYRLRLFNGDVGIVWDNKVYFNDYQKGGLRNFAYYALPAHETAYAMTVHRSQGSEFDQVLLVLPDKDNRILTRELVYTGISRAKSAVTIWADKAIFTKAITRVSARKSGLEDMLKS